MSPTTIYNGDIQRVSREYVSNHYLQRGYTTSQPRICLQPLSTTGIYNESAENMSPTTTYNGEIQRVSREYVSNHYLQRGKGVYFFPLHCLLSLENSSSALASEMGEVPTGDTFYTFAMSRTCTPSPPQRRRKSMFLSQLIYSGLKALQLHVQAHFANFSINGNFIFQRTSLWGLTI